MSLKTLAIWWTTDKDSLRLDDLDFEECGAVPLYIRESFAKRVGRNARGTIWKAPDFPNKVNFLGGVAPGKLTREEVKKQGLDGIVIWAEDANNEILKEIGYITDLYGNPAVDTNKEVKAKLGLSTDDDSDWKKCTTHFTNEIKKLFSALAEKSKPAEVRDPEAELPEKQISAPPNDDGDFFYELVQTVEEYGYAVVNTYPPLMGGTLVSTTVGLAMSRYYDFLMVGGTTDQHNTVLHRIAEAALNRNLLITVNHAYDLENGLGLVKFYNVTNVTNHYPELVQDSVKYANRKNMAGRVFYQVVFSDSEGRFPDDPNNRIGYVQALPVPPVNWNDPLGGGGGGPPTGPLTLSGKNPPTYY